MREEDQMASFEHFVKNFSGTDKYTSTKLPTLYYIIRRSINDCSSNVNTPSKSRGEPAEVLLSIDEKLLINKRE